MSAVLHRSQHAFLAVELPLTVLSTLLDIKIEEQFSLAISIYLINIMINMALHSNSNIHNTRRKVAIEVAEQDIKIFAVG